MQGFGAFEAKRSLACLVNAFPRMEFGAMLRRGWVGIQFFISLLLSRAFLFYENLNGVVVQRFKRGVSKWKSHVARLVPTLRWRGVGDCFAASIYVLYTFHIRFIYVLKRR